MPARNGDEPQMVRSCARRSLFAQTLSNSSRGDSGTDPLEVIEGHIRDRTGQRSENGGTQHGRGKNRGEKANIGRGAVRIQEPAVFEEGNELSVAVFMRIRGKHSQKLVGEPRTRASMLHQCLESFFESRRVTTPFSVMMAVI